MEVFGAEITPPDLIKILPGLFAALAAALRLIPNIVTAARGRRAHVVSELGSPLRIAEYAAPPPFSDEFAPRYDPTVDDPQAQKARKAMRDRTFRLCKAGLLVTTLLTVGYLLYGIRLQPLPTWSLLLALTLGVAIDVVLARTYSAVHDDPDRGSAAPTREGTILVSGNEADAKQHSLAALVDLGARLVQVKGSRILAVTGVSFGKDRWMGELIWVTLSDEAPGHVRVVVRSTKVDFISRSRSRRNVLSFLESWATFPGDQGRKSWRGFDAAPTTQDGSQRTSAGISPNPRPS